MSKWMGIQTIRWSCARAVITTALALAGCATPSGQPGHWDGPKALSTSSTQSWQYKGEAGWKITTPHYLIYTTIRMDNVRAMLPQVMEGAFAQYRELAVGVPISDKPMDCYVFLDRMEWNDFTKTTAGPDARIYLQIRRGGYAVGDRYVAYYIGVIPTASVTAHEGWHQFVARNFKGRLPPFLEEGLATTFEGVTFNDELPKWNPAINPLRAKALRESIDEHNLWPLEKLISMHAGQVVNSPGEKIEAFYAQCWCFAKFLREAEGGKYAPALHLWLAETANGTVFDPSRSHTRAGLPWNPSAVRPMLEHYLNMPLAEIDKAFAAYMHQVAYTDYPKQWNVGMW